MKKMRILMVAGGMDVGGQENQLMHLIRNADPLKFQIDFTSTNPNAFYQDEIRSLGGKFILIPDIDWKKPWVYCKELYRVMKKGEYDVVHSNELFHSGITVMIAYFAHIPCRFSHSHSSSMETKKYKFIGEIYMRIMRKMILMFSTQLLACSSWAGEYLYGERVTKRNNYHLLYNSVDTSVFLENYNAIETGEFCDDGWLNVLHVGRVVRLKNQDFLIKIAEKFKNQDKKIRFLCAGAIEDQGYFDEISEKITRSNVEEYIKMLGNRNDVDVLMRKANACVLPSKFEGMPLVLIEAQATGLPCVSASTFSHEVDFNIGLVQWIDLEDSVEQWAVGIEKAVNMSRAEKKQVVDAIKKNKFDSKLFADTLCELYMMDFKNRSDNKR